jgi:proteic killer suppression protein
VIRSFRGRGTEDVYNGADTPAARKVCPRQIWGIARRKLDQVNRVKTLPELSVPPGNHLERLVGDRKGQHSIRINDRFRVCFRWEAGDAHEVEITDYH